MMDYQAILDLVAPLDAFVTQHYLIAITLQGWIVQFVFRACKRKYGTMFDTKEPGDGYGFLEEQAKSEWESWKTYWK